LFKRAKEFASKNFDHWYILSAKYGLVSPDSVIEPYDKTLNKMASQERLRWAEQVYSKLTKCTKADDEITFIAGLNYRQYLIPLLSKRGNKILVPTEGMSIGKQLKWLKEQNYAANRKMHLDEFYSILKDLEGALDGKRVLSKCNGRMKWPERGIYFFFESGEFRSAQPNDLRIVRVGTHMVSKGSKATLWHRLYTHRGTEKGTGNHRGSVFRLHVGQAIIGKSKGKICVPTWGKGQFASSEVREVELELEKKVSEYIGRLSLLWLNPASDRAYIEKNSIGLLAGSNGPIDIPSKNWLGNFSPNETIRRSGLWNVNYVDCQYDDRFLDVLRKYVDAMAGRAPLPNNSIHASTDDIRCTTYARRIENAV